MGSPPRLHKLVRFLAFVSTTSALSLANFQIIASNAIPSTCIKAYSTHIPGCLIRDFRGASLCSSKCTNGLLEVEAKVGGACGGVDVNRETLLGIALRGDLISTLCPGVVVAPSSTTVTVTVPRATPPAQTPSPPSPPRPPPPKPPGPPPPGPPPPGPPPPPAVTTQTTLSTSTTAETTPRSTTAPETTSPAPTPSSTQVPTSAAEETPASPSAPPPNTNTQSPQTTAALPQTSPTGNGGRPAVIGGGGSPFDQPVIGGGRSTYTVCWTEAIWAAFGATAIILW